MGGLPIPRRADVAIPECTVHPISRQVQSPIQPIYSQGAIRDRDYTIGLLITLLKTNFSTEGQGCSTLLAQYCPSSLLRRVRIPIIQPMQAGKPFPQSMFSLGARHVLPFLHILYNQALSLIAVSHLLI